jgi:hypothetical protein
MAIGSSKDAAGKVKAARNPFMGKSLAEMKKMYSDMTPAQRKANVETFRAAAKTARKPVAKGGNKPRQTTKAKAKSRFYSSSSGTRGQSRPSNSPGPAVVKKGSKTGASVDPRERQLRKNRQEARRSGGSSSAGRANIRRMVEAQSGSKKRDQKQVEARRRRARQRGAARNRRQYLASKNNDM